MSEPPVQLVLILPEDIPAIARSDGALIRWGRRFTPLVGIDRDGEPATMHLDCTGCTHLFGGPRTMARRALDALQQDFDCTSRAVLAPTAAAARMLLQGTPDHERHGAFHEGLACIEPDQLTAVTDPLPMHAFVHDPAVRQRLHEVGFDTVAETFPAAQRAPDAFAARYGPGFVEGMRRVLGERLETPPPDRPPQAPCQVTQTFDGPVRCTQTLRLAVDGLLEQLTASLGRSLRGIEILQVRLERPRQDDLVAQVRFSAPTRDLPHLRSVLAPKLERLDPGEDGAESVRLIAVQAVAMGDQQAEVWTSPGPGPGDADDAADAGHAGHVEKLAELIDVLSQRCTVARRFAGPGHLPEACQAAGAAAPDIDRPSRIFDYAVRIDVQLPRDGSGVLLWKRRRFVLRDARGPERIVEPWWTPGSEPGTRDYWRVQRADGQWLWIYRLDRGSTLDARRSTFDVRLSNHWFLHGAWT